MQTKWPNRKKKKIPLVNNEQLGDSSSRKALKVIRAHAVLKGRSSCEVQLGEFPEMEVVRFNESWEPGEME